MNAFLDRFVTDKQARTHFTRAWELALQYGEIEFKGDPPLCLQLQILAENVSRNVVHYALQQLSQKEQRQLIGDLFSHYREGSWFLLRELTQWNELIENLRSGFYPLDLFESGHSPEELEQFAIKESKDILNLLRDIVPAMIRSAGENDISDYFGDYHFSEEEMLLWARIFGLKGDFPFLQIEGKDFKEKLTYIKAVFQNPLLFVNIEEFRIKLYLFFMKTWIEHLRALNRNRAFFREGLENLIVAIPTKGRDLRHEATLETLLIGLKPLCRLVDYPLNTIPIYVYDQSEPVLSEKNKRVIDQLNQQHKTAIRHFNLADILEMASQYGISPLIETTENSLGYGGMRNTVFLLSPLIKDPKLALFESPYRILMSDDDNEFPVSNFFCHAFFAAKSKGRFIGMRTYFSGRNTQTIEVPGVGMPSTIHIKWTDQPFFASMSEYNSNSKICLNLPFASEEGHLDTSFEHYPLLKASLHLSGPRYPTPEKIAAYTPYAFGVLLVQWLLDPLKKRGLCALPWNDDALDLFQSLREAVNCMADPAVQKEMQKRFWHNMGLKNKLSEIIDQLPLSDDVSYLREYKKKVTQKNVEQLKAKMESRYKMKFEDYPLTNSLYLICKRVGTGEFCQILHAVALPFKD